MSSLISVSRSAATDCGALGSIIARSESRWSTARIVKSPGEVALAGRPRILPGERAGAMPSQSDAAQVVPVALGAGFGRAHAWQHVLLHHDPAIVVLLPQLGCDGREIHIPLAE